MAQALARARAIAQEANDQCHRDVVAASQQIQDELHKQNQQLLGILGANGVNPSSSFTVGIIVGYILGVPERLEIAGTVLVGESATIYYSLVRGTNSLLMGQLRAALLGLLSGDLVQSLDAYDASLIDALSVNYSAAGDKQFPVP
jgi:hypothetical protein